MPLRVQVDLANPSGALRPGMYATIAFTTEFPQRLVVPGTAVAIQGDQAYSFFVLDGKAKQTPVKIGLRDGLQALWLIFRFNLFCSLAASFTRVPELKRAERRVFPNALGGRTYG